MEWRQSVTDGRMDSCEHGIRTGPKLSWATILCVRAGEFCTVALSVYRVFRTCLTRAMLWGEEIVDLLCVHVRAMLLSIILNTSTEGLIALKVGLLLDKWGGRVCRGGCKKQRWIFKKLAAIPPSRGETETPRNTPFLRKQRLAPNRIPHFVRIANQRQTRKRGP